MVFFFYKKLLQVIVLIFSSEKKKYVVNLLVFNEHLNYLKFHFNQNFDMITSYLYGRTMLIWICSLIWMEQC